MITDLFMKILDLSITASVVILLVMLARVCLKKVPRVISYALWAVVLFRLLCPVTLELPVSAVPEIEPVKDSYALADIQVSSEEAGAAAYRAVANQFSDFPGASRQLIPIAKPDSVGKTVYVNMKWTDIAVIFGKYVWLLGMAAMVVYSVISYWKLRRKMAVRIRLEEGVFICDDIGSPFVMGIVRPTVYLPSGIDPKERSYILAHERHHIRRMDPLWKLLAYAALTLHWFNPLVWVAFILACKDMEVSCDEAVIRQMGSEVRAEYAASLATMATGKRIIAGTPLAFAEGDPKSRIRNLAKWKKPVVWVVVMSVILSVVLAGCLLVDPVKTDTKPTVPTEPAGTSPQQAEGTVDIRPLPPKNPGNSLIDYDPNRTIYIGSEHVYMDFYPGITRIPSFCFYIFSRQPLNPEEISVALPVDLPFVVYVDYQDYVQRKTDARIQMEGSGAFGGMPYYLYLAYRGETFVQGIDTSAVDLDSGMYQVEDADGNMVPATDVLAGFSKLKEGKEIEPRYREFALLKEEDLPEFYVYSVTVGLLNIESLEKEVELEKLDLTIGDEVYEAKLGRVRLLPADSFPVDCPIDRVKGKTTNGCLLYNDGVSYLSGVFEMENAPEDITLTGLYTAEEDSRVLSIRVNLTSGGQSVEMQWDGKTPIPVYKGDSVSISAVIKNPHTAKLLNYVMCHTIVEYVNSDNEKVCRVDTQVGRGSENLYEYYAIIFDGVDMEPYYENYIYRYWYQDVNAFRGK